MLDTHLEFEVYLEYEVSKKVRMLLVGFEVGLLCFDSAISIMINRIKTNIAISIKAPKLVCYFAYEKKKKVLLLTKSSNIFDSSKP